MQADDGVIEIEVCMGSSCFARGNSENLEIIHVYLQDSKLKASVRLSGRLCHDLCKQGPNLIIGGVLYHGVTAEKLRELLDLSCGPLRGDHETI
jgi:NADH:ubiquinone oxidoreductase subunit E